MTTTPTTSVTFTITVDLPAGLSDDELLDLLAKAVGTMQGRGRVASCSFTREG